MSVDTIDLVWTTEAARQTLGSQVIAFSPGDAATLRWTCREATGDRTGRTLGFFLATTLDPDTPVLSLADSRFGSAAGAVLALTLASADTRNLVGGEYVWELWDLAVNRELAHGTAELPATPAWGPPPPLPPLILTLARGGTGEDMADNADGVVVKAGPRMGTVPFPADALKFLNGVGAWVTLAGGGDMTRAVYDTNGDGVVDFASGAPWAGITGKPATFPPSAHGHPLADLTQSGATTGQVPTWSGAAWVAQTPSGGGGSPGGSSGQIQINNAGAFAGYPALTYDDATKTWSLYQLFTDVSNWARGVIRWVLNGSTQELVIGTEAAGTGTLWPVRVKTRRGHSVLIDANGGTGDKVAFYGDAPLGLMFAANSNSAGVEFWTVEGSFGAVVDSPGGARTRHRLVYGSYSGYVTMDSNGSLDLSTTANCVAIMAPAAAPPDSSLLNSRVCWYLDETGNNLKVRVRYSDGTLKTGTVALT